MAGNYLCPKEEESYRLSGTELKPNLTQKTTQKRKLFAQDILDEIDKLDSIRYGC